MANHADLARANAKLTPRGLVATKPIYDGDEILVNYGSDYGFDEPVIGKTHSVAQRLVRSTPRRLR